MTNSEDAALLQEIARVAGSINSFKRGGSKHPPTTVYRRGGGFRGRYRGGYRGSPYRGRGGYKPHAASRQLINRPCTDWTRTGNVLVANQPCQFYTNSGKCKNGITCSFKHDPERIALCKSVIFGGLGSCHNPTCTLQHTPNEHNSPMCVHFANNKCTRADCRFTHMAHLMPNAPICPSFALEGWCDKGAQCTKMHSFECPEFASNGTCTRSKCDLQHTVRAPTQASQPVSQPSKAQSIDVKLLLDDIESDEDEKEDEKEDKKTDVKSHQADDLSSDDFLSESDLDGAPEGEHVDDNDDEGFITL